MAFVHYQQVDERQRMHKGVERDIERRKARQERQEREAPQERDRSER
jgi:hypothetical protein